jgi:hypothetical protein
MNPAPCVCVHQEAAMKLRWATRLGALLALAGCDRLADENTRGPALAKMSGTLILGDGMDPPEGQLRLSMLWQNYAASGEAEVVCGDNEQIGRGGETVLFEHQLELDTDFPAAFSVELSEPPPAGALMPSSTDPSVDLANGDLVVYRDVNGNGRLDLHGFAGSSPDQVIGSSDGISMRGEGQRARYRIVYLSDDIPFAGANEVEGDGSAGYTLTVSRWDEEDGWSFEAGPPEDAEIELTLAATPYLQRFTCSETCQADEELECPENPADLDFASLGEPLPSRVVPVVHWEHVEGEHTVLTSLECLRGPTGENDDMREVYAFNRITYAGCVWTSLACRYDKSQLPAGVELPCGEWINVNFADMP